MVADSIQRDRITRCLACDLCRVLWGSGTATCTVVGESVGALAEQREKMTHSGRVVQGCQHPERGRPRKGGGKEGWPLTVRREVEA